MPQVRRSRDEDDVLADINVIPLVDVVLVLLIIFMLTAPLLQRTIDVQLPRARSAHLTEEERMVVSITREGLYYFDRFPVAAEQLEDFIRQGAPTWKDRSVYVRADAAVPYERVIQLLDALRRYGISRVGLLTRPWTPERKP